MKKSVSLSLGKVMVASVEAQNVVIRALIFSIVLAPTFSANAEPVRRQCAGLLHADRDGELYFEVPAGGLCKIARTERAKVLGRCRVNSICHVEGTAENCKDQAECSEVLQILSAARGQ
jgi:hypothetical protein